MSIPFPKIDQARVALAAAKQQNRNRRNDIKNIQSKSKVHRAPAFTKFLVGRIYSDTSMSKAKRLKILEIRNRRKQIAKAEKDMLKLKKEIKEVKELEKKVAAVQASKKRKRRRRVKKSIVIIQKTYRGHLAKRLVHEIKAQRAAIVVQTIFRGVSKRKKYMQNIDKHRKHTAALDVIFDDSHALEEIRVAQEERAAMVIQNYMRIKLQKMKELLKRKIEAARMIQAIVRGRKSRQRVDKIVAAIARDRLASELFITQLRPSLRRIGEMGFSQIDDQNKRAYAVSLHSSAKFRKGPSSKLLANKMSHNAKKILKAAKRTQQLNTTRHYSQMEQRKRYEDKAVSSSILSSNTTTTIIPSPAVKSNSNISSSTPTPPRLKLQETRHVKQQQQQPPSSPIIPNKNMYQKTKELRKNKTSSIPTTGTYTTNDNTFITTNHDDNNNNMNVVNDILAFNDSIVSKGSELDLNDESQSYADDFESEFDGLLSSIENVNAIDTTDKDNTVINNNNNMKNKEANETKNNNNDDDNDEDNYSDNFDDDVSFGSEFDDDLVALNNTKNTTNSNDKKDEHNKKVNDIGTETRQQSAYGRAVYKKNDGSPEGYRVPIRPSNTYTMERSGTRQRRPGRIIQNSK